MLPLKISSSREIIIIEDNNKLHTRLLHVRRKQEALHIYEYHLVATFFSMDEVMHKIGTFYWYDSPEETGF